MIADKRIAYLAGLSLSALASPVFAQSADKGGDAYSEIVVTAQKRVENLKDVPVPVTVVSGDQLAKQRVYTIADLARTSPSLEMIQAFGGPGGGGQIRGLGTQSFSRSAEGAVGVVVDDVPQGNVPNAAIFDLDRVEVLRGPQGTLFGLTASAGVINMKTVAPKIGQLSGYVHVDFADKGTAGSEYGQLTTRGAVNIPLSDRAALRIAANYNRLTGVQTNNFNKTDNVQHDTAVRARLLFKPTDTVTVNLIGDYDFRSQNYSDPQFTYVSATPALTAQLAACGIVPSYDNNARCSSRANFTRNRNFGFSGQIDVEAGEGTISSITGWRKNEQLPSSVDIMSNPLDFEQIFVTGQINRGEQFSQELRYTNGKGAAFEYTVGAFFSDYHASTGFAPGGAFTVGSAFIAPVFVTFVSNSSVTRTTNQSYAAFGQGTYHVNDQLGVIVGLRFTHQKLHDEETNVTSPTSGNLTQSNLSGKFGLQYKASPDLNLYATVTRGYKGPQIIPASLGTPATVIKAEIPMAYEIGAKGSLGRLGYEASLFLTKVENYQGQRCSLNPVGVLSCTGESIPSVTSKGFELSFFGKPIPELYLNAGFAYNDAKFPTGWTGYNPNDLTGATTTNLGGLQLVGSPKTKFTFNAEYTVPVGSAEVYFGGDATHKSSVRLGYSGDPRFVYPSAWTVSLRAGVRGPDGRWSLEAFVRNLTKNREPATLFGGPSFTGPSATSNGFVNGISGWVVPTSRRVVGLSGEVRF